VFRGAPTKGGRRQKKTPQGFLATTHLLCQTLWNKSNNNNRPRPRFTRINRKTKECLPLQRCVECGPCHAEQLGHLRGAFALRDEFPRVGDLLRRELGLTPQLHPTPFRRVPARFCPLLDQGAFQFREDADHLPHGAAGGRLGVDGFR
jgi:hypothetical protein